MSPWLPARVDGRVNGGHPGAAAARGAAHSLLGSRAHTRPSLRALSHPERSTNSIPKAQTAAEPLADGEMDGLSAATLRMTYGDRVGSRKAMAATLPNFVVLDKKVRSKENVPCVCHPR